LDYLKKNDLALLKFSYRFLKSVLFPEDAGRMQAARPGADKADEMD
jgi:hypothetical protein